jgi:hypothetical protein
MAREAGGFGYVHDAGDEPHKWQFTLTELKALVALVRADERKNRSHSLGPGEMELSLRREHNGELFEYRYRFTQMQILHGPQNLVEGTAGRLDAEITHAIRARGNT